MQLETQNVSDLHLPSLVVFRINCKISLAGWEAALRTPAMSMTSASLQDYSH